MNLVVLSPLLGAISVALLFFGAFMVGRSVSGAEGSSSHRWGDTNPIVVTLARPFRAFALSQLQDIVATTDANLARAGMPHGRIGGAEYVGRSVFYGVLAASVLVTLGVSRAMFEGLTLIVLFIVVILATVLMQNTVLNNLADERSRKINNAFPYFLDMMVLSLRAGANTPEAIDLFINNNPDEPLTEEMRLTRDETQAGVRFEQALPGLAERLGNKDLRTVIMNIQHGIEMGTSLADVLEMQSADIRFFRTQNVERAIEKMRVNIQLPLVLMLISAMALIIGPAIVTAANSGMF